MCWFFFQLDAASIRTVVASTVDSSKVAAGVNVGAEKFILVRSDPGVYIVLKKGPNGMVAYRSTQCNFNFIVQ